MTTDYKIGYCTNVHAGASLEETKSNLAEHAIRVRDRFSPGEPMGVGLWLSSATATSLRQGKRLAEFGDWLDENGLLPFTMNGFPFGDFHQAVVKHRVYEPTWFSDDRVAYTSSLITILDHLLPAEMPGSISTLPIAWGDPRPSDDQWQTAAASLRTVSRQLRELESRSGRRIQLAIEPEPGCAIQFSQDVVDFFEKYLLSSGDESTIRRYITVCHDVCHASVMFEEQEDVVEKYRAAGIDVGKVQISSAVELPMAEMSSADRKDAIAQLSSFSEDRYLHQTVVRDRAGATFYEDLPLALVARAEQPADEEYWRVHFHVPIYLEAFGKLRATRSAITECLAAFRKTMPHVAHFEIETYAWGVLPEPLKQPQLADGIAQELGWFQSLCESD